jgi:hypothetical protein
VKAKCSSTARRVYQFVRAAVPEGFPAEALKELDQLPAESWRAFAHGENARILVRNPLLANLLEGITLPRVATTASTPLFNGTIIFVQVVFDTASKTGLMISNDNILSMALYVRSAMVPIQQYASQYGICSANVQVTFVTIQKTIVGPVFPDSDIGEWADKIVADYGFKNACLVFPFDISDTSRPNPQSLVTPVNGFIDGGYHTRTGSGTTYCVVAVSGSTVQMLDVDGYYAEFLSHELAEMMVNPTGGFGNPEVCDGCSDGNCSNGRRIGFGRQNEYLGDATSQLFGKYYYIAGIAKFGSIDPDSDNNCALPTLEPVGVCVYPPPLSWPGQGTLAFNGSNIQIAAVVAIAGHYSVADQRHVVLVGTQDRHVHEVYWKEGQVGVEGADQLPLSIADPISAMGSTYDSDEQRHVVFVGTSAGKVREIYWKSDTNGVEGQDDLPVPFSPNSIRGLAGLYDPDQKRFIVVVGTTAGKVHEIFWKSSTAGIEGHDDLPIDFSSNSIVSVAAWYDTQFRRYHVVVATNQGALREIWWRADTQGIEGSGDLPVSFESGSIVSVAGFYDPLQQREFLIVATRDGSIRQLYWKEGMSGIEAHSFIARIDGVAIIRLTAFYGNARGVGHIVVALSDGTLREFWTAPERALHSPPHFPPGPIRAELVSV